MPRVFRLIAAILIVDTAFFAAIVPLLPHYVDEFGLSQTAAGILTASYAAGTLLGALPAGVLVGRVGVRRGMLVGLATLGASSFVFGLAEASWLLISARFVQGFGGACLWASSFAWLIGDSPSERRGEVIGAAIAAAIGGVMLGPVLGAAAVEIGEIWVFGSVALAAAFLAAWVLRMPAPTIVGAGVSGLLRARRGPMFVATLWVVTLPAIFTGAIDVLVPLRLDELGGSAVLIGAVFLGAAATEGVLSPVVGRVSDRRGRMGPIAVGLAAAALIGILLPLVGVLSLMVVGTVAIVAALAMFWAPGFALLSETSEDAGLDPGMSGSLMNLTWAGGMVIGGIIGGGFADLAGDGAAYALLVAACVVTLGFVLSRREGLPAET